ncbi:uncharacterized protein cubi_01215 [Cryptosporidium ubiquitum]|uniref:E3 ubiquitin-protein ligase n=1 Tax=Cryptosporidium ubiquitum TaxID=857276 RepID=A0A1J4MLP0_9CRYT|nr:uncharacterized protein cubi_01215 [Cryptosporidium ubiquitum]OII74371.1 hypothetical protein cubi_01215 [Cryptosporidium ubiquitum]
MQVPVIHTNRSQVTNHDYVDFTKVPKLTVKESIMKQWFSINKACYSSLQALRFRLLCLRAHLIKCGPELPKNIYNGSTFNLSLSYDEYVSLFIDDKENESQSELLGDIMFLICELVDDRYSHTNTWNTFLAIELFSTAYSLDDEKIYWYVAICETNKDIEYNLPKSSTQKWVKQAKKLKFDSEINATGNFNSLNPTNETLDFVIISILELLMNPEFDDFTSIFKNNDLDSAFFSSLRLPKEMGTLNRCSQIWSGQHIAYRCITCGTSTSSCICVDCFQNGNHENHEYYIYKSDYGGCCDCGDEQAWSKEGFCRKHNIKDIQSSNSNANLNSDLLRSKLKGIFHGILCHVVCLSRLYCTAPNTKEIYLPFHSKLVSKIIEQNRNDEKTEDNFNVLDFYMQDEDLSDDSELNIFPSYFDSDSFRVENGLDDGNVNNDTNRNTIINNVEDNSFENEIEQIYERVEMSDNQTNSEDPVIFDNLNAALPQENHFFEDIPILHFQTIRGQNLNDTTIPILLLFKQEKKFQMDSYFFQWFISLCENYQSIFLPLMGELFGSPIHKLLMFGILNHPSLNDDLKSSNKYACKLLKPLIEEYINKRIHTLTTQKVKDFLREIHSDFKFVSVKESDESQNAIIQENTSENYMLDFRNGDESISDEFDIKIEILTYLDIFWMKWSRQLNEANDSLIHQALVSKIYKQNDLTDLLLVMMFDSKFKEEIFPDIFMRNYNELVKRQDKVLTRIAVQLFTIDRMLISMALDNNLIQNIFFTTFQILQSSVVYQKVCHKNKEDSKSKFPVPTLSSNSSAVVNRKYTYSMHDSKYLLQCIDLIYFIFLNKSTKMLQEELSCRHIEPEETKYLSKKLYMELWYNGWLSLLRLVQCMNPHKSKIVEPFEDLKWHSSLLLCCDIQSTVDILLQIIFLLTRIPGDSSLMPLSLEYEGLDLTTFCIFRLVLNTVQSLIQWIHITSINESWNIKYEYVENRSFNIDKTFGRYFVKFEYASTINGNYTLHNQSIIENWASIHIPLNRTSLQLIYIYLDYTSRKKDCIDSKYIFELVENLGILNDVLKISIIEHPLRAYCFVHQAFYLNDGSWLRNGLSPINEAQFYKKSHWSTMYILLDIFSIRLVLNILDNQDSILFMISSILTHFNLIEDEINCENNNHHSKKDMDMVDHFQISSDTDNNSILKDVKESINPCFNVLGLRKAIDKKANCAVLFIMDIFTKITSLDLPNSLSFNKSVYRYLLVQYLIRKNRSRSEIQDGLPISSSSSLYYGNFIQSIKSSNLNTIIDEILDSFCEKIPAFDNKPILYKIKQPIGWMLYDPLLPVKFLGSEDNSNGESICSYFNDWPNSLSKNSKLCRDVISIEDGSLKKRRIGENSMLEHNNRNQNGIFGKNEIEEAQDNSERKFINNKFTKFPIKLCHIPLNEHFSSAIHFNSSQNMYIKSILLSNILHLALPKLFGLCISQTLMDDVRIIHHSFILLFNLINIEIIEYIYKAFKASNNEESQTKIEFNRVPLNTEEPGTKNQTNKEILEFNEDPTYEFFSIPLEANTNFKQIGGLNSPVCKNSHSSRLFNVSIYCLNQDGDNDDYQYFAVQPNLCSLIKEELSKKVGNNLIQNTTPIVLKDLNMINICDLLRKNRIESVFELLITPLILSFENDIRHEKPFCLMDILVEVLYSLRINDNDIHLGKDKNKFKFVKKDVLKLIPIESSFFLEWGLSIANHTSPEIESYFRSYLEGLYMERVASLQEKAINLKETNFKEKIQEKQKNILQEYMKKQKNFMNNFKKSMLLSNEENKVDNQDGIKLEKICVGNQGVDNEENSDFCVFCHELISGNQGHDNNDEHIATFGYLDLQNTSLDSKRNIQSDTTLDGLQPNFGYTSFYLTICGHLIHYKCVSQYYKLFNNEISSGSNDGSSRSGQETRQIQTEECSLEMKSKIQYVGFPLTYYKNKVALSVKQVGTRDKVENFDKANVETSSSSIHVLSSISDNLGSKFNNKVRQYDINKQIYHLTNLTCPYCNTFSNIILPFKYFKREDLMMEKGNEEKNFLVCKDDYLMQVLDILMDFQRKDEIFNLFGDNYEGNSELNNIEIDIESIPILEQILSILTLFNHLLPFNIPGVNLFINGIPGINPIGFLIKIISDNIVIDTISNSDEAGLFFIKPFPSSRSLMYKIVFDSLRSIINHFPSLSISMIYNLFPVVRDESKIDIWDFISLQSPTARFQILVNLVILIDATRSLRRQNSQDNNHSGSFCHTKMNDLHASIGISCLHNDIRDNFERESESDETLDDDKLRITYIMLNMFILEVFSIVWTFWNPEWDQDEGISNIKNPIVQLILNLNKNKRSQVDEESDEQKDNQLNENEVLSFFQDLIYGNVFNLHKKLDSNSGEVEYKAQKINNLSDSRMNVNIFGALPIQITPVNSEILVSENKNKSERFYSFKLKDYMDKKVGNNIHELSLNKYPRYILNVNSSYLNTKKTSKKYNQNQENGLMEEFKLKDIKKLKDIINLGIIIWLKLVIGFQNIYMEGKSKKNDNSNHKDNGLNGCEDNNLSEQISILLESISSRFCANANILEMAWKTLTEFDVEERNTNPKNSSIVMMKSLLSNILESNLFIKLISKKKPIIPLSSLEVFKIQDNLDNVKILLFNSNIDSFYKNLNFEEFEIFKNSFQELGKKFLHINEYGQNIVIYNGFNQSTILPPKMFHNLYNKLLSKPIKHWSRKYCNNINNLLICISCGSILCTEYNCCNETETSTNLSSSILSSYFYCHTKGTGRTEDENISSYSIPFGSGLNISLRSIPIRDHIAKCGKGLSFFLHVSSSIILSFRIDISSTKNEANGNLFNWIEADKRLLYGGRACEFSTLYVDEYGEEDKYLIRGKPMILCPYRWIKLQNIVQKINARRNTHLNWRSFQPFEFQSINA